MVLLVEVTHITYATTIIPLEKTIVTFDFNSYQAHFVKKDNINDILMNYYFTFIIFY
jgi:hypothetical protein